MMTSTMADGYMRIRADTSQLGKDLDSGATKAAEHAGGKAGKSFSSSFIPGIGGIAAAIGGMFAIDKVTSFFSGAIAEAREAEKVGKLTEAVIKSTGGAAKISAKQVEDLAGALSKKAGVDDELIQSGANMFLTFTKVRNEVGKGNDIFNRATETALDMSVAMGTDMKGAAIQLGKALNDPIAGVGALAEVGVSFTAQQKEQIKALVESGDILSAQKIILDELAVEFGGAGAAGATAADKARVAWGNMKETIGTALLPVMDKLSGFITGTLAPGVEALVSGIQGGSDNMPGFSGKMQTAGEKIREFYDVAVKVAGWFKEHKPAVEAIIIAIGALTVAQIALNIAMAANPVGAVIIGIAALAAGFIWLYRNVEIVHKYVDFVIKAWVTAFQWAWAAIQFVFNVWVGGFKWVWEQGSKFIGWIVDAFKAIPGAVSGIWDGLTSGFKAAINWIIDKWNNFSIGFDGFSFAGVHTPGVRIDTPNIPRLAKGGTVKATPGGVLALLGEGGHDERVIPLDGSESGRGYGPQQVTVVLDVRGGDATFRDMVRKWARQDGRGNLQAAIER